MLFTAGTCSEKPTSRFRCPQQVQRKYVCRKISMSVLPRGIAPKLLSRGGFHTLQLLNPNVVSVGNHVIILGAPLILRTDTEAWTTMEWTGFHVYIAARAPTDHSPSIESSQTNRRFASPRIKYPRPQKEKNIFCPLLARQVDP
jgi:hypothetical protein